MAAAMEGEAADAVVAEEHQAAVEWKMRHQRRWDQRKVNACEEGCEDSSSERDFEVNSEATMTYSMLRAPQEANDTSTGWTPPHHTHRHPQPDPGPTCVNPVAAANPLGRVSDGGHPSPRERDVKTLEPSDTFSGQDLI